MELAGFLAIWSDLAPDDETDWAHWITREHAGERVGIDGFIACRIFRALGTGINRYFILYELEKPEIVGSPQLIPSMSAFVEGNDAGIGQAVEGAFLVCRS